MTTPYRWISEEQVRERLPMPKLIDLMADTLAAFSSAQVEQPVRTVVEVASNAFFGVMPALIKNSPALGAKLVTVFGSNPAKGLPTHLATILLLDPETGVLLTVMDGRYITEARTAAVSAVSVRYMAKEDAKVLAILGSGVQAHSHLEALTLVRNFTEIRCWSPTRANLERFTNEHPQVEPAPSAQAAVEGADVIALVTASTTPVIQSDWIQDGAHVIAVGACRPTHRETDPRLVARAHLIVDSRAAALKEAGDIVLAICDGLFDPDHIKGELGEVILGSTNRRDNPSQVTMFKSLGLACEDVAAANLVFNLI